MITKTGWKFLVLILGIFVSCKSEPNLNGHWHLYDSKGDPSEMATLDITDTIGFFGKVFLGNQRKVTVDYKKEIITLHHIEIGGDFKFSFKGDTLKIGDYWYGIKLGDKSCVFETDYFAASKLKIDLPVIKFSNVKRKLPSITSLYAFVGRPKLGLQVKYGDTTRIEIGGRLIELSDLKKENQRLSIKLSERHRDEIYLRLIADHQTKMDEIMNLVNKQRKISSEEIYLVGKIKKSIESKLEFCYLPLEEDLAFTPEETLQEWLNKRK